MAAQGFTTGPVDCWVGIGTSGSPVKLGYSKSGFSIANRSQWENHMSDLAGTKLPLQRSWAGADALLTGTLTVWDELVRKALGQFMDPKSAYAGTIPSGRERTLSRGALIQTEGLDFAVWLRFPLGILPTYSALGGGYHYHSCTMDPETLQAGAKPMEVEVAFYALGAPQADGSFILFDQDMSALPANP